MPHAHAISRPRLTVVASSPAVRGARPAAAPPPAPALDATALDGALPGDGVGEPEALAGAPADGVGEPEALAAAAPAADGVLLGDRDADAGAAGHTAGVFSCENSQLPGAQRAPMAGPACCPLTQRCAPVPVVHQPQLVMSPKGSARPSTRHVAHVASRGHLSSGSPAQ